MSVIVQIPHKGGWHVNNAAFRILSNESRKHLSQDDQKALDAGQALGLLSLDKLDEPQAQRIALAFQTAATALRPALRASTDTWEQSLADALDDLSMRLTELAGTGDG